MQLINLYQVQTDFGCSTSVFWFGIDRERLPELKPYRLWRLRKENVVPEDACDKILMRALSHLRAGRTSGFAIHSYCSAITFLKN
jgi:hypothetical protein